MSVHCYICQGFCGCSRRRVVNASGRHEYPETYGEWAVRIVGWTYAAFAVAYVIAAAVCVAHGLVAK